ncbi:putative hydrolase [Bacillus sp. TS-2]|nr:putative hydrolase [Bacillus sp. TS-2]
MKLLTLNTHSWQEDHQDDKLDILARQIAEEKFDVIALQEVNQSKHSPIKKGKVKEDLFVEVLLERLEKYSQKNFQYIWDISHYSYGEYEEGVALLTHHPIISSRSFFVTKSHELTNWKTRKIICATITIGKEELDFYSCHLGWWSDSEEPALHQMERLLHSLSKKRTSYLLGDFNSPSNVRNQGYDYLINHGLFDTYSMALEKDSGITVKGDIAGWSKNTKDLRIDFVFTTEKKSIRKSTVIFNGTNAPIVSDHFGVMVDI